MLQQHGQHCFAFPLRLGLYHVITYNAVGSIHHMLLNTKS
ncbi:unnamed protein product [Tenebrio molitor]|nr:unnamed protein product [Tenebrio molitor]